MPSRCLGNRADLGRSGGPVSHLRHGIGRVVEDTCRGMPALRAGVGPGFGPNLDVKETPLGLELAALLRGATEDITELSLEGNLPTPGGGKRAERGSRETGVQHRGAATADSSAACACPYRALDAAGRPSLRPYYAEPRPVGGSSVTQPPAWSFPPSPA